MAASLREAASEASGNRVQVEILGNTTAPSPESSPPKNGGEEIV
jgi:hypothetical protein